MTFEEAVAAEYERICAKYSAIRSSYHGMLLIQEEWEDLRKAVLDQRFPDGAEVSEIDKSVCLHELVQIAARCKRFAVDVCGAKP